MSQPIHPPSTSSSSLSGSAVRAEPCTEYRDRALGKLARLVALKTLLPLGLLAWTTTKSWAMVALSLAFMPLAVLIQSAIGLTIFRITNGVPPIPVTPRHGVVLVHPQDKTPQHVLGELPGRSVGPEATTTTASTENNHDDDASYEIPFSTVQLKQSEFLDHASTQRPLRLLVVGDSLAIGVGQSHWPTPIMPETIAKTLSKKLGGRAVYWTCHGATGASIGWVIRELERGVHYLSSNNKRNNSNGRNNANGNIATANTNPDSHNIDTNGKIPPSCSSTESDESCSEDSFSDSGSENRPPLAVDGLVEGEETLPNVEIWRKRLLRHRRRFEPDLAGFYDIVVFVTGPNDAKSALLPFLLTGEDGELRKQAQKRGSSFSHDLHLLLDTLSRKMRLRVQFLRQRVEAAAESVLESVEHSMERIAPGSTARFHLSSSLSSFPTSSSSQRQDDNSYNEPHDDDDDHHHNDESHNHHGRPLVIFPGLPTNALPVFQNIPMCWYGGPPISFYAPTAIGILDAHKHDIACTYPNDIIFVPAPTKAQAAQYILHQGPYFGARTRENTILSVRDISEEDSKAQEERLRAYYQTKGKSAFSNSPFRSIRSFLGVPIPINFKSNAVDGVHPNELGYDFWGRYLGLAIYEEWEKREGRRTARDKKKQ